MTVVTFAAILGIIRMITKQNFIIMASDLLVEFSWLVGVILISLLLRVGNDQIKSAFRIYSPLMLIGFFVITFRIILIPNDLVNFIFPPILLLCTLWQWNVIQRHNKKVPRLDMIYTWISLAVFTVSTFCSWIGFTLLAVQIIIWWMMQLTCILSITCIKDWLEVYAERKNLKHKPITNKWFFRFINKVALPVAGVFSFIIAIYWAAAVFNMSDTTWMIFNKHYIDSENFSASLYSLSLVACLYFLFNYLNITTTDIMRHHFEKSDPTSRSFQDYDVQECAAGSGLGHLADDSSHDIPCRQILIIGHLRRFINGSGFCIERHLGEHLLWRFPHDGSRESWRLHHL